MSDSSRRPTPRMPAGSSTLSERIASLQRKASESGAGESSRPTSPLIRGNRAASEAASPPHKSSIQQHSHSNDPLVKIAGSSQAVRDRIARFQQNAGEPLVPRASFGAPTPNPEDGGKALRPYPGAGGWGENAALRPQMTGGWGGGSSGGLGRSLMPQVTGPITWAQRRQASTPASLGSLHSQSLTSGRDAFADLDDALSSTTGSQSIALHAADVASQAAALKGMSLAPQERGPREGSIVSSKSMGALPTLPDAPSGEIEANPLNGASARRIIDRDSVGEDVAEQLPAFPDPPNDTPHAKLPPASSNQDPTALHSSITTEDTSIEVGVAGMTLKEFEALSQRADFAEDKEHSSPERVAKMQCTAPSPAEPSLVSVSTSPMLEGKQYMGSKEPHSESSEGNTRGGGPCDNLLGTTVALNNHGQMSRVEGNNGRDDTRSSPSSKDSMAISPSTSEDVIPRTPPSSASIGMTSSGSSSSFAAKQAARDVIAAGRKKSLAGFSPSSSAEVLYDGQRQKGEESSPLSKVPSTQSVKASEASKHPILPAVRSAEGENSIPPATATPRNPTIVSKATTTKPRRSGGSIRRPPPGKMLNLADLDASDDEYEPGWASVISSTR